MRVGFEDKGLIGESRTTEIELVGKFVQRIKGYIGNALIGQRPEPLGGLEFWGIRRKKAEANTLRHDDLRTGVPAGIVDNDDDGFVRPRARVTGEGVEDLLKQGNIDAVGHPPFDAASCGLHEAVEIYPLIFVRADSDRSLSALGPYSAQNGFETETVFVERPDFYGTPGMFLAGGPHHTLQFFLNAAWAAGDAAFAWRGRGR